MALPWLITDLKDLWLSAKFEVSSNPLGLSLPLYSTLEVIVFVTVISNSNTYHFPKVIFKRCHTYCRFEYIRPCPITTLLSFGCRLQIINIQLASNHIFSRHDIEDSHSHHLILSLFIKDMSRRCNNLIMFLPSSLSASFLSGLRKMVKI